jgi:hypothetical protein
MKSQDTGTAFFSENQFEQLELSINEKKTGQPTVQEEYPKRLEDLLDRVEKLNEEMSRLYEDIDPLINRKSH